MASTAVGRDELQAYTVTDAVLADVLERAWSAIAQFEAAASLDELHLVILNPKVASPALMTSHYFTTSCQALRAEMLIVVNEQFLLELETAIRSFAQAESLFGIPYLKSDPQLFGLVRRIQMDPGRYLERLRRSTQRAGADPQAEELIRRELAMVTLFFLGHELGHLIGRHESGQFSTFVDPDAPLDDRLEEAVVKLCRHVDEFAPTQFGLPGFEQAAAAGTDVRRVAEAFRAQDETRYQHQEAFFANEADADKWANDVVVDHLAALSKGDSTEARHSLYLLARGLFVAALYTWYRDLDLFGRKLGAGSIDDAQDLTIAMSRSREQYVHAASLFGENHRFTLLRAALALETILRAQTGWFDLPPETRKIHVEVDDRTLAADAAARSEWWLSECLRRYFLLCICMDTAVKIAHVGCASGWIRGADRKRGSGQTLIMVFESIDQAVGRLRRFA